MDLRGVFIMIELWKDIPNYKGRYQASNRGRIKSLGNNRTRKVKILKQFINTKGYYSLALWINGKPKQYRVHQLIAITFHNHKPDGSMKLQTDHKDGNKLNNKADNIHILTQLQHEQKNMIENMVRRLKPMS